MNSRFQRKWLSISNAGKTEPRILSPIVDLTHHPATIYEDFAQTYARIYAQDFFR
ncbi:MAG: hypothetical protein HC789_05565 [Microcoleus sp. CSU_2_2]|nr:hypothetical protein [Microcoleus sp. CSU_2_2]